MLSSRDYFVCGGVVFVMSNVVCVSSLRPTPPSSTAPPAQAGIFALSLKELLVLFQV